MSFQRLSIVGFGLVGASLAQAVRRAMVGCRVVAFDRRPEEIEPFLHDGLTAAATAVEACAEADCIVLAVPPQNIPPLLSEIRSAIPPGAIVTDVASVKANVVAAAEAMLVRPARFVGGHPMAGGERSGSAMSRADLFDGAAVVLTPTAITDPSAVDAVQTFWQTLGARVIRLSPQAHDQAVAAVSHLPHAIAAALMHVVPVGAAGIVGAGFRDTTRIAAGNPELWRQILIENGREVAQVLQSMQNQLHELEQMLSGGRSDELERWLAQAATLRRGLDQSADT